MPAHPIAPYPVCIQCWWVHALQDVTGVITLRTNPLQLISLRDIRVEPDIRICLYLSKLGQLGNQ